MADRGAPGDRPRGPRQLGDALGRVVETSFPRTLLADVQVAWPGIVGDVVAARSEPVAERDGRVTIACESGPWAQELEMMGEMLFGRLAAEVGEERLSALRFTADLSRHR
jgi:predicted nucleic acid-binding Zn ribbon protein